VEPCQPRGCTIDVSGTLTGSGEVAVLNETLRRGNSRRRIVEAEGELDVLVNGGAKLGTDGTDAKSSFSKRGGGGTKSNGTDG